MAVVPEEHIYITPGSGNDDVVRLMSLCHRGIEYALRAGYQPPHWDHEPTPEELKSEEKYRQKADDYLQSAKNMARTIYRALTGENPEDAANRDEADYQRLKEIEH